MNKDLKKQFNEYIYECEYSKRLRPETIRGYREAFNRFFILMPEVTTIQRVNQSVMNEFFYLLQTRRRTVGKNNNVTGVRDSTIRTYYGRFNPFFQWLIYRGYLKLNPLTEKPPYPVFDDKRALVRKDIDKLIAAINLNSPNSFLLRRDLLIIYLLTFCGLRKNELISLQLKDVDIEKRILTVRGETSKSRRSRQIPINHILCIALKDYYHELKKLNKTTQYLLVTYNRDKNLTAFGMRYWVRKLSNWTGLKFHLHRFRHTFATSLAKQNTNSIKIQKLLGHTDLRMTDRYLRSMGVEDLRGDIDRMNIDNLIN